MRCNSLSRHAVSRPMPCHTIPYHSMSHAILRQGAAFPWHQYNLCLALTMAAKSCQKPHAMRRHADDSRGAGELSGQGPMTSGFEMTSTILTSSETHSVQFSSVQLFCNRRVFYLAALAGAVGVLSLAQWTIYGSGGPVLPQEEMGPKAMRFGRTVPRHQLLLLFPNDATYTSCPNPNSNGAPTTDLDPKKQVIPTTWHRAPLVLQDNTGNHRKLFLWRPLTVQDCAEGGRARSCSKGGIVQGP